MNVALIANWGLCLEILKELSKTSDVLLSLIITQYNQSSKNKWFNCVYDYALVNDFNPINQKDLTYSELENKMDEYKINLLICHSFMKILPKEIFSKPKYGTINIHPSLLPKYRGPSPTYWVLKNKETVTGLTCHYINEGIDTGDIIHQVKVPVLKNDTLDTVIERQKMVIEALIKESLNKIKDKDFIATKQNGEEATYAPRPQKGAC